MKRSILTLFFGAFLLTGFAQSLDEINKLMGDNKLPEAKAGIDAHLSNPTNSAKSEPWYFKGRIYNGYSYDASLSNEEKAKLKAGAFDAFKKAQELDQKDIRMKMEGHKSYLDLYFGFYDLGANFFNDKKYDDAFNSFTKALEVKDYILSKNYTYTETTLHKLDTALILNSAIAASQAKKDDVAMSYYQKLIDANVAGPNYLEIYEYMVAQYSKKEDAAGLAAMLEKAKRLYPDNAYWSEIEIKQIANSGDQAAVMAKYDELIAKDPKNFHLAYNYAVELYNGIYGRDAVAGSKEKEKAKLTEVLKIAIAADPNNDANLLMSNHMFNAASDYSIEASLVTGTKPEDVKKKKELNDAAMKAMNDFIPVGEATIAKFETMQPLTPTAKANYKNVLSYMSDAYNFKKDTKKAAEFDKKRDAVN